MRYLSIPDERCEVVLYDRETIGGLFRAMRTLRCDIWDVHACDWRSHRLDDPILVHESLQATLLLRVPNVAPCVGFGAALSEVEGNCSNGEDEEPRFTWAQKGKFVERGSGKGANKVLRHY